MLHFLCVVGEVRPHPTTPLPCREQLIQWPVPSMGILPLKPGGSGKEKHLKKGERNVNLNNLQSLNSMPRAILWFKVPRTGYTRFPRARVGAAKLCLVGPGPEISCAVRDTGVLAPHQRLKASPHSFAEQHLLWCSVLLLQPQIIQEPLPLSPKSGANAVAAGVELDEKVLNTPFIKIKKII